AERLGGGAILACVCVALAPIFAVEGHLLTMNAFEPLLYLGTVMLVARILRGGDDRLWIGVGALPGLALLNKLSFLFYAASLLLAALKGKAYYVAAAWAPLLAAGGAALKERWRIPAAIAVALGGAALLPLILPVLPPEGLVSYQAALGVSPPRLENKKYGALPQHLADMFGWEELRDAVAWGAVQIEPGEHAAVFAQNYGEASALELFGSAG